MGDRSLPTSFAQRQQDRPKEIGYHQARHQLVLEPSPEGSQIILSCGILRLLEKGLSLHVW